MITDAPEREPLEPDFRDTPVPLLAGEEEDASEPHIWRGID
ncbi:MULTISPECIES: surface protein [Streptomyces]|uniref:Uncharacterized protein n=1 Tax=Streptomyces radiopugnans TaxID=403935 RepID=A0A1H9CVC4_9ACTN|nr:surface protein [Streptomyces radiopugnans]URN12809.1 surface protein [Streptomyces radiopugnans]SEQ05124.1 hypothetical protein SAMN05216481_103457 [Streptomyces radiopugnans]